MPHLPRVALAVAGVALLPLATPALAKTKANTVRLPASSLADPAAKLCMPKTMITKPAADLPATVCQTQAEWAAAGVTIVPR